MQGMNWHDAHCIQLVGKKRREVHCMEWHDAHCIFLHKQPQIMHALKNYLLFIFTLKRSTDRQETQVLGNLNTRDSTLSQMVQLFK